LSLQATADQALVRRLNTALIAECLRSHGPLSRANLSDETGLSRSTVSSLINALLEKGFVREIGLETPGIGRPGILLELDPKGGSAVGIEIGVDFISVVLTDFIAQVLWRQRVVSNPDDEQSVIFERAEELIQQALAVGEQHDLQCLGIGVGVPGLVNAHQGTLVFAPNLAWHKVPIRDKWTLRFHLPIFVENEANAAALGEFCFGVAQHVQNLIYLSAGFGLGAGIIIEGQLFCGSGGYAGEVGHMTIDPDGELCGCGKHGCWETIVGPRAIAHRARKALQDNKDSHIYTLVDGDLSRIDVNTVIQAAEAGDPVARNALRETGVQLGIGIGNLVNAFNPQMVVLGGALSAASPFIMPVIEKVVQQHALPQPYESLELAASAHGVDACVMGGIALVLDDVLAEPML
jgi:glucokinase-like ROK family protein